MSPPASSFAFASLAALAFASAGCATTSTFRSSGYCAPPVVDDAPLDEEPAPPAAAKRDERMAALLGLRGVLLERRASHEASVESRLRVLERIERARLTIAATSAELDCEGERAQQAADYLAHKATSGTQALTVGSIAAAAATAIASVFLSTSNAKASTQDVVGISGGVVTAGLGLGSLYVHPRIDFPHPRNLLSDLWSGPPRSTTYPPLVWAYFTRAQFSNEEKQAIREKIVARWRRFQDLANDPAETALLFGAGGAYDAETLKTRAAMLDEVKAEVDLASQDIAALASELSP